MLHHRGDDVPLARTGLERRVNRRDVALRRTRSEDDLARLCPNQFRHLRPCRLDHASFDLNLQAVD